MSPERRMTLKQAAEMFFGDARHAATLRVEISRGNLVASKMGRAYWTTLPALQNMEEKCRVEAQARDSGSIRKEELGLSSTVEADAARDSLLMNLDKLRKPSANTSRRSMSSKTAPRRSSQTY